MEQIGCGNRQVRQGPNLSSAKAFRSVSRSRDWPEDLRKQPKTCRELKNTYQPRTSWWWRQDSNLQPTAMGRWPIPIESTGPQGNSARAQVRATIPIARLHQSDQSFVSRRKPARWRCHLSLAFHSASPSVALLASIGECRRQVCLCPGSGGRADI
jgi:hypothetical protein